MAWGSKKQGLEDVSRRLRDNDPSLSSLTLFHTRRCNEDDLAMLFSALRGNTVLKELNILPCHVVTPTSARQAAGMLLHQEGPPLHSLSLGHHEFGDGGVEALAPGISGGGLTHLDLDNKGITSHGAQCLASSLGSLKELNLSRNQIGDHGLSSLLTSSHLEILTLQSCGVTLALTWEGVTSGSLTTLDLSGNRLEQSPGLARLIPSLDNLRELNLRDCELGTLAAAAVLSSIEEGSSIKGLDLSGRQSFGDEALSSLSSARGLSLESLNLGRYYSSSEQGVQGGTTGGSSGVQGRGATGVQEGTSSSGEGITLLGVHHLSSAFPSLTSLDLTGASLKGEADRCKEAFAALGTGCKGLKHLRLVGTGLGDEGALAFVSVGDCFEDLADLSVSACGLTTQGLAGFLSAITRGTRSRIPKVSSLECGANATGDEEDLTSAIRALAVARPRLAVHCRSTLEEGDKEKEEGA